MVPHLGAGVGVGFEDAYVLYRLLIHPQTQLKDLEARASHHSPPYLLSDPLIFRAFSAFMTQSDHHEPPW